MAYYDIDPQDIDPDTGRPYSNYSSPALDTSFHDGEMDIDDDDDEDEGEIVSALLEVAIQAERDLAAKLAMCAGGDEIQLAAINQKLDAARAAIAKARVTE